MVLYVAYVGVEYEGGSPLGVYESVDAAVEAVRQHVVRDDVAPYVGTDYYEVYAYELGAPPVDICYQSPVAWGEQAALLDAA
jgi:hypothetical protein